jgi:hypothetical protein
MREGVAAARALPLPEQAHRLAWKHCAIYPDRERRQFLYRQLYPWYLKRLQEEEEE